MADTRADHLAWCKQRALEYVERGDLNNAFKSMMSDLRKHPETGDHVAITLGASLMLNGHLDTAQQMKEFIEGFA
jgi:hypothetical protein